MFRCLRKANSIASGLIRPKFENLPYIMQVNGTSKFKRRSDQKQPTKRGDINFQIWAANSVVSDEIWQNFKRIQVFMYVLSYCMDLTKKADQTR